MEVPSVSATNIRLFNMVVTPLGHRTQNLSKSSFTMLVQETKILNFYINLKEKSQHEILKKYRQILLIKACGIHSATINFLFVYYTKDLGVFGR